MSGLASKGSLTEDDVDVRVITCEEEIVGILKQHEVMMGLLVAAAVVLLALPVFAQDPLHRFKVEAEFTSEACERKKNFGGWIDADGDGENTRQEVLIAESVVPVTRDSSGLVDGGLWLGPYAVFLTRSPRLLDIDHVVPLGRRRHPHYIREASIR